MSHKPLVNPAVSLTGETILVTGANTGIGKVTSRELARAGARVIMACRSKERAEAAMADIRAEVPEASLEFLALDLANLAKTKAAAAEAVERFGAIHRLVANAGLAGQRGETADGFELAFGVNHIGHAAFIAGVEPALQSGGRVVLVASKAHYKAKRMDFDAVTRPTATRTGFPEYCVSKLANVLHAHTLAERLKPRNIDVYALHPGVVASDIWREVPGFIRVIMKWFMLDNEDGARTSLHCATAPEAAGQTGLYWDECKPKKPSALALDTELRAELARRTEEWIG